MKKLYLIRHAKSSWDDPSLPDFDRPLNDRGARDAPRMGKRLRKQGIAPDLMVSSTAVRASKTALAIADVIRYPPTRIRMQDELYHASPSEILHEVQKTADDVQTLFLFGHNPGLTDFASRIGKTSIDNIVTCGVYALQLDVKRWKEVKLDGKAKLLFYDYPKRKE